MEVELS